MSLWIACYTCREPFEAELHPGLVRCPSCTDRAAYRLPAAAPTVVHLDLPEVAA